MQAFSKFKRLSRDIKLIIITALIVSCVGVYAAGECIISATADDVSYNNTTVQAAIDDLFSMSKNYCPPGYECTKITLYNIMKKNAVLDNIASTYVTSSSGIDFSQVSSDTNGKGIYEIASTANDSYPIYYYRGAVDNNNVKFAGFCWKAIRTTDTGGVKMIYNGEPDGSGNCTNTTGASTQIGTSAFNTNDNSPADVGYMYGTRYTYLRKDSSELATAYVFGNDVTYSGGTYTLVDTMTTTGTWTSDYNTLNNNHYTCFSTGNTCSNVYYVFYTNSNYAYYITLENDKKVEDALDEMFNSSDTNTNNSTAKTLVDNWYNTNLSSYTSYIEDTIYCNDRSIGRLGGWDPNGQTTTYSAYMLFNTYKRTWNTYTPTLECSRELDRFTVSSTKGNGALTYPIGLITSDEGIYAGEKYDAKNITCFLYTDNNYFTLGPSAYDTASSIIYFNSSGYFNGNSVSGSYGVRPVISLASADVVIFGDGTATNPYVIQTS